MKVRQTRDFRGEVKGPVTVVELEHGDDLTLEVRDSLSVRRHVTVVMWEEDRGADDA